MKHGHCLFQLSALILSALVLTNCGSGGSSGGGTPSPVALPAQTIVSGTVQAPGGLVALFKKNSLSDLFVSESYAALTGLADVLDDTTVQLARLNSNATSFTVITTTSTSGGRYSFNLTALGLQPANDLIVRVEGSGGKEMRAFAVSSVADLNPVSEAAYQLATQSLNAGPLNNLTLQEISDITGAVGLVGALQNIGNATSIDQAVGLVKTAVGANVQVAGFITAAATAGQTTQGTGDVGNFYPFEQGNIWRYNGTRTVAGPTIAYENTVLVSGQGPAPGHGVNSTIFSETNAEGENRAEKSYGVKGPSGITAYGNDDPADDLTRQLAPFQAVHFPLTIGSTTLLEERTGLDWGTDEDGDGRNETLTLRLFQLVDPMESVTVPAGTFPNALKITQLAGFLVTFTTGGNVLLIQYSTAWHVPGVGMIKQKVQAQIEEEPMVTVLTEELLGYVVNGQGSGARIELGDGNLGPGSPLNLRLENTRQLFGALYDQSNRLIPGVPFSYSSTNPQVVSINAEGVATALSPGTAIITAHFGSLASNEVPITVNDVRVRSLPTKDMVYDPVSRKLYASVPNNSGSLSNTITIIDPESGTIGQSLNMGLDPGKLAMSDNGQYLYVGLDGENAIQRVNLSGFTAGPKFFLHTNPALNCPVWIAGEIRVQPGNPLVIAVLILQCGNPAGVEIYDNGIRRPDVVSENLGIAFSQSAGTLFGIKGGTFGHIYRLTVSSTGVAVATVSQVLDELLGTHLEFDTGRLFSTGAQIFDATTLGEIGRFQHPDLVHGGLVAPDVGRNRVFFVPTAFGPQILGFDATTFQWVGSIPILHNLDSATFGLFRGSLTKWGTNGLAFRAGNDPGADGLGIGDKIVLLRTTAIP